MGGLCTLISLMIDSGRNCWLGGGRAYCAYGSNPNTDSFDIDVRLRVLSNSESSTADGYRSLSMIESHDVRFAPSASLYVLSGDAEIALSGAPRDVSNILSPRPGRAMLRSE